VRASQPASQPANQSFNENVFFSPFDESIAFENIKGHA